MHNFGSKHLKLHENMSNFSLPFFFQIFQQFGQMKVQLSGMASSPFPTMRFLLPPLLSDRVSREVKILNQQPRKLSISKHLPVTQRLLRTSRLILSTIQQSILPGQNPKGPMVSSKVRIASFYSRFYLVPK